jgi:Bacterial Ig-like domain (group 2)
MQTATGNLINDRAWGAETVPGLEARRWTGYIDVKSTDAVGKWYAVSLPNTGRRDELLEPDRVAVLPTDFKVNHFAIQPYNVKFAGTAAQLSLRNPGFLDNEKTIQFVNQTPYLNELFLRTTAGPSLLPSPPYLAHQMWIKLINAPKTDERLIISIGAIRKAEVFDWFRPEREETGALIWGERRNGTIGIIPGSEGFGDDGIRPGGRDFPTEDFFSVSPGTADLTPGQTITFYASGPATWTLVGGGTLSSTTGNTVIYTAPAGVGSATVTAVSIDDPTSSVQVPITIAVPTVSAVDLISDQSALLVGGSANLIATVTGTGAFNPNVTFTFTGPATLSGSGNSRTLVATGPGTITVTATSVGDPSKFKTITIASTVPVPVVTAITLSSDRYTMDTLQTANLLASVIATNGGSTAVTFTITGPGTLSGAGNSRTLTPTGPGTISVTATSVQDPTKTATISIAVGVGISVTTITLTGTPQANSPLGTTNLMATVNGTGAYNAAVTWSIIGAGPGALTPGVFSSPTTAGALTFDATPTAGTTTVRVTSVADPSKFADFVVTLGVDALITSIVVTPSATTVAPGGSFTATALVNPSTRSQAVTWSVTGPATLSVTAGVPTVTTTGPGVVTITATSVANPGVFGSAIVNSVVTPLVTSVLAYRVTNSGGLILDTNPPPVPGGTSTFVSATVYGQGAISPLVTWSIVSGGGTLTPLSPNVAQYTAPAITTVGQSATLRATSVADPSKFGDVVIGFDTTVAVSSVAWSPDGPIASNWTDEDASPVSATVNVLGTGAYSRAVTFTAPPGVTVTPGALVGTTTPVVISFAPTLPKTPASYTVRATSVQDPTRFDDLIINRSYSLSPITVETQYLEPNGDPYPFWGNPGPVPPTIEVGSPWRVGATINAPFISTPRTVTWTVTGPTNFLVRTAGPSGYQELLLAPTGIGTISVTATSTYDPSVSSTKIFIVAATPVVTSVQVYRPDGLAVTASVYRGTTTLPEKNLVVFTGRALGTNVPGLFATDSVNWSIVSGPGTLADAGLIDNPFPGIGGSYAYSASYIAPPFPLTIVPVTLRATSFEDPNKFTDVTFQILPDPASSVVQSVILIGGYDAASVPAVNASDIDTNYYMPGANSVSFDIRRTFILKSSISGGGLGWTSGTTVSVVAGNSIASLIPIPIPSGYPGESYFNLTRNGTAGGWVVVRSTSVFDPTKFKEIAYYFKPQVFSLMAVTQTWGPNPFGVPVGRSDNVLRVHNAGFPTVPIVITSAVNVSVYPLEEPPVPQPAEIDPANGRTIATVFLFLSTTGPYSITAHPLGDPASSQTVTFGRNLQGFTVGEIPENPFVFDLTPYAPSSYSISPAVPPRPTITSNP